MLKLKHNSMRQPIGGHHFPSHGTTFKADSFTDLVKKVGEFRTINHLPYGSPDQEILAFYLNNWPYLVEEDRSATDKKRDTISQMWLDWVRNTWSSGHSYKYATRKEAKERWEICRRCPFNVAIGDMSTEEMQAAKSQIFLLKQGTGTPSDLGFCVLHKSDTSMLTLLDQSELVSLSRKDNNCWITTLAGR